MTKCQLKYITFNLIIKVVLRHSPVICKNAETWSMVRVTKFRTHLPLLFGKQAIHTYTHLHTHYQTVACWLQQCYWGC